MKFQELEQHARDKFKILLPAFSKNFDLAEDKTNSIEDIFAHAFISGFACAIQQEEKEKEIL